VGKKIAVSFEEDHIKVVKAALRGGHAFIEHTEIIEYHELDSYLEQEKATEFIVTYDFKEAFHGTMKIPVVKPRYQKSLIESELRKITKLEQLSFVHIPLGERIENGRKSQEVFYFAVNDEVIQDVVGRFYDYGKTVRAVYPTVFSAAALLNSEDNDDGKMGIFSTGMEKIVFFVKNGEVHFIRNYESLDDDLSDFDIQNINMTISYCFQNFRQNPSSLVLLGSLAGSGEFSAFPTVPVVAPLIPPGVHCGEEDFNRFFLPIASLFAPRSANVLSGYFKNINLIKTSMSVAAALFMTTVVIGGMMIFSEIGSLYRTRSAMESLRPDSSEVESVYSSYLEKRGEFENVMPLIGFLNSKHSDIGGLLAGIGSLPSRDMKFKSLDASVTGNGDYSVTITGEGDSEDYTGLQSSFRKLIADLGSSEGVKVKGTTLNLTGKTFRIDLEYRGEG